MTKEFNKDQISFFKQNGFLLQRSFFNIDQCNKLLYELKNLKKDNVVNSDSIRSTFLKNIDSEINHFHGLTYLQKANLLCPCINDFMSQKLLNKCSELLLKSDLFFGENEIHIRQPNVSHTIPSHQDNFYFCLENGLALTCYVYLTKQNRTSGGLGFFKSSINNKTLPHQKSSIEGFSSFNEEKELLSEKFFYPNTQPGDVVYHYSQTFHRADPNFTNNATASISIRVFSESNLKKNDSMKSNYLNNLNFNRNA